MYELHLRFIVRILRFMVNELLVNLVNTVLGTGKRTARGNQAYHCPFCNHHKPKLEVNFTENKKGYNPFQCWVCGKKGKTIRSLFKALKVSPDKFIELGKLVKTGSHVEEVIIENIVELPKEFKQISEDAKQITLPDSRYYRRNGRYWFSFESYPFHIIVLVNTKILRCYFWYRCFWIT